MYFFFQLEMYIDLLFFKFFLYSNSKYSSRVIRPSTCQQHRFRIQRQVSHLLFQKYLYNTVAPALSNQANACARLLNTLRQITELE